MSHIGKSRRYIQSRRAIEDIKLTKVLDENGAYITGVRDGDQLIGEFKGTGDKLLVGLSTATQFDSDLVFADNEKGIAIGYIPTIVNFVIICNDGAGTRMITTLPPFKDNEIHKFDIELKFSTARAVCKFDDNPDNTRIISTKIPNVPTDTLNVISYGIY